MPSPSEIAEHDTERWNSLMDWLSDELLEMGHQLEEADEFEHEELIEVEEQIEHPSLMSQMPITSIMRHRVRPSTALSQTSTIATSSCSRASTPLSPDQIFVNPEDVAEDTIAFGSRHRYTPSPLTIPRPSTELERPPRARTPLLRHRASSPHLVPSAPPKACRTPDLPPLPPSPSTPALSSSRTTSLDIDRSFALSTATHTPSTNFSSLPSRTFSPTIPLPLSQPSEPTVSLIRSWLEVAKHLGHSHSPRTRKVIITGRNFVTLNEGILRRWIEKETCGKVSAVDLVTNDHGVYPEWHVEISKICKLSKIFNISKHMRMDIPSIGLLTVTWPEKEKVRNSLIPDVNNNLPIVIPPRERQKSLTRRLYSKTIRPFTH